MDSCSAPFFRLPLIQAVRNFLGKDSSFDLVIYAAVILVIKVSMLGIMHNRALTSLFLMCFSLTCSHLIARILRIAPWWKLESLLRFCFDRFQVLHPHSTAFRGPAT